MELKEELPADFEDSVMNKIKSTKLKKEIYEIVIDTTVNVVKTMLDSILIIFKKK